jgi:hypothetical protein
LNRVTNCTNVAMSPSSQPVSRSMELELADPADDPARPLALGRAIRLRPGPPPIAKRDRRCGGSRAKSRLIGCAAKIGEMGGRADGGDRRAGSWAPGTIDLGIGVSAIRYRAGYR